MNTSYGMQLYMAHSLCFNLPLLVFPFFPFSSPLLTWNPPSCDRNRPPQSQVARKLTPPVPHLAPCTLPSKIPTPIGFSRSHVHLIRATLQPILLWSRTVLYLMAQMLQNWGARDIFRSPDCTNATDLGVREGHIHPSHSYHVYNCTILYSTL
jgi:hypothetical protein